jgi:hypothetical protein
MKEFFGCEDATAQWLCGDSPMRTGFSVIDLGLEADAIGRGGIVVGGRPGVGAIDGVGELDGEFHGDHSMPKSSSLTNTLGALTANLRPPE